MPERDRQDDLVHGVPPLAVSSTSTLVNKTGSWKYIRPLYRDLVAPCNAGCPVGIDIEAYMNLIREDRLDEALELLMKENPLPATTGRVCYHPCEESCNRRLLDASVAIHAVERMLGDRALRLPLPERIEPTRGERVAVVGSGPAGLSCAFHLVRMGYAVTVFEAADEPGGVLRLGIPSYRLPREVLSREIARIEALGVEFRCGTRVGTDVPFATLEGFDAVFLATGVHRSRTLGIEGEKLDAVRPGLAFLREVNGGGRPSLGTRVVVVGGGNTAIDCARTARRLGSEVDVMYRRSQAEMPANEQEIGEAQREGVSFTMLAAPVAVRARDGRLEGLECVRMRLGEPDASGRRRPEPVEGSRFFVPADTVLTAIGEAADFGGWPPELTRDDSTIPVDGLGESGRPGLFAGGDIIEQPHTVAHAIGSGKRAAIGIDRRLRAKAGETVEQEPASTTFGPDGNVSMARWRGEDPIVRHGSIDEVVRFEQLNTNHFRHVIRNEDRHLSAARSRTGFAEVNEGLKHDEAEAEALRCLNCGVCNRCEVCLIFCPDAAITRDPAGNGFIIDYEYCKGCGVCSAECPRGAMTMTREGL